MTLMLNDMSAINKNGVWAPACAAHGFDVYKNFYSIEFRVPDASDNSLSKCLWEWINDP